MLNGFFLKEDFGTVLCFDSLEINVLHCKLQSFLNFKSVLENFKYAFHTVLEKDKYFSCNSDGITFRFGNFPKNLNLLVKELAIKDQS